MVSKTADISHLLSAIPNPNKLLDVMGLVTDDVFKKPPVECPICGSHEFDELTILGVFEEPVLWECGACESLHLKYDRKWLVERLEKSKEIYSNFEDWVVPPKDKFN